MGGGVQYVNDKQILTIQISVKYKRYLTHDGESSDLNDRVH